MKMPFPGMDPYYEHPLLWHGRHLCLIVHISNQLNKNVIPDYWVSLEARTIVERSPHGPIHAKQRCITIQERRSNWRVVTVVELVTLANKVPGPGRRSYRRQQRKCLVAGVNLVEIDLLRKGKHTVAAPRFVTHSSEYDYLVSVNRGGNRSCFEMYPFTLRDRLPKVLVPLSPSREVVLDLQECLEEHYSRGGDMLCIKYDEPCIPALSPEDQTWAFERWAAYKAAHPEWFGSPSTTG